MYSGRLIWNPQGILKKRRIYPKVKQIRRKKEGRAANPNARESFRQVAGSDKALGAFESDSYWDKYR